MFTPSNLAFIYIVQYVLVYNSIWDKLNVRGTHMPIASAPQHIRALYAASPSHLADILSVPWL